MTIPSPHPAPTFRTRVDGWTPERQQQFLAALAATRRVVAAAAAVGMSARSAYKLRQHPAAVAFREGWHAALALPAMTPGPSLGDRAAARVTSEYRRGDTVFRVDRPLSTLALIKLLERTRARVDRAERAQSSHPAPDAQKSAIS